MLIHQVLKAVAGLVILDVIAVYAYCLSIKARYPPSHPWSAIALAFLSVGVILQLRQSERLKPTEVRFPVWVFAGAAAVAAGLWTFAAMVAP